MKFGFWTGFSWLFSNWSFFSLEEDFEKNVVELDVENLDGSWARNLIENLVRNWVDNYKQEFDCENLVCAAHDCSDSMKN